MQCPNCSSVLRKVNVEVEGAKEKASSFQCPKCDYVEFEPRSAARVVKQLEAKSPLKIKQKIVKISKNRIGMYFNKNVIESLRLKSGETIFVSVPDKHHVLVNISH